MDRLNKSTSANCADKRKKQSNRFSSVCFFIFLHCAFVAKANEWNFDASGTFEVSSDKTFTEPVYVGNNTLTLNVINSVVFLRDYQNQTITTSMFQIDGGKLVINGADGKVVTFDGNFDIDYVYTNGLPDSYVGPRSGAAIFMTGSSTVELHYVDFTNFLCNRRNGGNDAGVINFFNSDNDNDGSATFDHINFYKCYAGIPRPEEPTGNNDNKWGRIINIQSGTWNITMTNSSIRHCYINEPYSSNTSINGMGGAIRSQGNVGGILRLTDCAFEDNLYYDRYTGKLAGQGGVINWRSGNNTGSDPAHLIIKDCRFVRNKAKQGGAIATNAKITIERNTTDPTKYTYISKNEAVEGGGIYFWTYNGGQASYDGDGFDAILGDDNADSDYLRIYDNYARDFGGGVYITIDPSKDVGFNSDNQPISPNFYVRFYKGCRVAYNRSPKGAGVAIIDNAGNKHYNGAGQTPANTWSGVYNRHIYFDGSKVENNKTLLKYGETVPSEVAGGGIYISKQRSPDGSFSNDFDDSTNGGGGLLTVDLVSGTCSGNNAVAGTFVLNEHFYDDQDLPFDDSETGTSPGYGGGYYIASLFEGTVNSTLNVNIGEVGKDLQMYNNEAYTDGGGVYVLYDREDGCQNEGTVTVNAGTIGKIDTTDPQNPVLCPNKALNGNGGGICVMSGTVVVENGHVDYNTANQNGGGIYLNDGDLTFTGGSVEQNEASNGNGGGICVMGGTVEMDGGQVDHNTANQKGGGIYLNGGDLTFTGGSVDQNEASISDGGGICVDGGNIVVSGGSVSNNEAKQSNGGGISVLGGLISIASGSIEYNIAALDGGGVYVSVPENVPDDESLPTYIFDNTYINQNVAGRNGGGVCVDNGELYIHSADYDVAAEYYDFGEEFAVPYGLEQAENETDHTRITNNKALAGKGGGVYLEEGYLCLGNALLYNNEAKLDGGGGYVGTGYILSSDAKILQNKAGQSGGGVSCFSGDFDIFGGDISYNEAKLGDGGGCCITKGNIQLWPDFYNGEIGTVVSYNKAGVNGGGLCNNAGQLELYWPEVHHNEAGYNTLGGNGGGIYCNSGDDDGQPNQRIFFVNLLDNKAHGDSDDENAPLGCGGGIYMENGRYYSEYNTFLRNTAQTSGGAIYCHDGELRAYQVTIGSDGNGNTATNGRGGGILTRQGNIVIGPCDTYYEEGILDEISYIEHNTAKTDGGGICNLQGNITLIRSGINHNSAEEGKGGGVFITGGDLTMLGGQVNNNTANHLTEGKGGGVYSGGGTFQIMERQPNPIVNFFAFETVYKTDEYGYYVLDDYGNLIIVGYNFVYKMTHKGLPVNPTHTFHKGVSYTTDHNWADSTYTQNDATNIVEGRVTNFFNLDTDTFDPNTTYYFKACAWYEDDNGNKYYYAESPVFEYDFSDSKATGKGIRKHRSPNFGTSIPGDKAKGKASNRPRSIYPSVEENPFFMELTPLQQAIMADTPEADSTTFRKRKNRPVRANEPSDIPEINYNTATYGGGVCIDQRNARLIFAGTRGEIGEDGIGQINFNYASEAGGGIYIDYETNDDPALSGPAMMQMMGKCEVNANRVPANKLGGGIYLDGRLYVGDKATDAIGTHGLMVDKNFAINKEQAEFEADYAAIVGGTASDELQNEYFSVLHNAYLTRYDSDYEVNMTDEGDNNVSVITLLSDISGYSDEQTPYSHIGFHVERGFCPVIATSKGFGQNYDVFNLGSKDDKSNSDSELWLYNLMTMAGSDASGAANSMRGAVFEDTESYVAVHIRVNIEPFLLKFIYLWGCWTHPIVKEDPERDTGLEAGLAQNDQSMVGTGKHYKITNWEQNKADGTGEPLNWEIYSPEGLSWFTAYVNGLNAFDEVEGMNVAPHYRWNVKQNPRANAKIMNDIDMSAYLWVPIGSVMKFYQNGDEAGSLFLDSDQAAPNGYTSGQHYYGGTFDGQGHVISGLRCFLLTGIEKFGLFGYLADSAVVKNTFVDESLFRGDSKTMAYSVGGIAGEMKRKKASNPAPIVSNSEARMSFDASFSARGTKMGGLVGEVKAGEIHSSMAMPDMVGQNKGESGVDPSFTAFEGCMGGLVGELGSGCDLKNSFSNSEITLVDSDGATDNPAENSRHLGGLVGLNNGTVENCYSRYQGTTPPEGFGWFAGKNNYTAAGETTPAVIGTIKYCYAPRVANETSYNYATSFNYVKSNEGTLQYQENYGVTSLVSGKYGFKHRDQQMTTNTQNGNIINDVFLGGLLPTLNKWVTEANTQQTPTGGESGGGESGGSGSNEDPGGGSGGEGTTTEENPIVYSSWTRTMASPINDDYPVLQIADFNVVGSEDGIYMKYDTCVNRMWASDGKNFQSLTAADNPNAAMYLYNTNYNAVNIHNNTAARLYIHEDVGITQEDGKELTARVGVTFDNSNGSPLPALGGKPYDWHMFSSALQNVPMGLEYYDDNTNYPVQTSYETLKTTGLLDNNTQYHSRSFMDPPRATWYQSDNSSGFSFNKERDKIGYFPTNTPYGSSAYEGGKGGPKNTSGSFDFYCFDEETRHWINFKRKGADGFYDHWHLDAVPTSDPNATWVHHNIEYENEETMQVGKGYMMGVSAVSMLMADGILNNGDVTSQEPLTNSEYSFNMSGYSEELRGTNLVGNPFQSYLNFSALANDDDNKNIIENGTYYLFDADARRYLCYPADASTNPINAPQFIHPHQGFFVKTANGGNLTFKNSMRSATAGNGSTFRGDNLNYPLVNLFCYDAEGHYDVTTVEMNRPKLGGGSKLKDMRNGNSLIYARLEDEDYQTLFAPTGTSTVPVRFEPSQDGVYTMRWGTLHGDFHYLHLVDNMSGADVDMLRSEEYRFEATTSDYISRFKLVFEVTDVEENPIEAEATTFAFCMGDEIIVNGTGYLEVFDVQGRRLSAKRLVDAQSSVSLPNVAAGIYFLRLSDDKQVRTQKMVINY